MIIDEDSIRYNLALRTLIAELQRLNRRFNGLHGEVPQVTAEIASIEAAIRQIEGPRKQPMRLCLPARCRTHHEQLQASARFIAALRSADPVSRNRLGRK